MFAVGDSLSSCAAAAAGLIRHVVSQPLDKRDTRLAAAPFDLLPDSESALLNVSGVHAQSSAARLVKF